MATKQKETPHDARQRRSQNAVLAIVEADEPKQVTLAELARLRSFVDRCWSDVQEQDEEAA